MRLNIPVTYTVQNRGHPCTAVTQAFLDSSLFAVAMQSCAHAARQSVAASADWQVEYTNAEVAVGCAVSRLADSFLSQDNQERHGSPAGPRETLAVGAVPVAGAAGDVATGCTPFGSSR